MNLFLNYTTMADFTRKIFIGDKAYIFVFNKVIKPGAIKYFVSAYHEGNIKAVFEIGRKPENGRYRVLQPAPPWAIEIETFLLQIIAENGAA